MNVISSASHWVGGYVVGVRVAGELVVGSFQGCNSMGKMCFPLKTFLCEYCESFKNSYFEEHLPEAASGGVQGVFRLFQILQENTCLVSS